MSAMKTHELWDIIHGDDITFENEEGQQKMTVKKLLVYRRNPSLCQIFTEGESTGSISSRNTRVYSGKIESMVPTDKATNFTIKAKVGDNIQGLTLESVKSQQSECTIS
tara:strand:- start:6082 stop:6408 length:327 start_codon:yes stop_codon:yes gene_type:complete